MRNAVKSASGGSKLFVFMMVSLDGYMEGVDHDLSWHNVDEEFNAFAAQQMQEADTILFGRRTYELMESYWPTKAGIADDPMVAKLMNETPKVVFSRSLKQVIQTDIWKHVTLIKENVKQEIQKLKKQSEKTIVVLGSNNLCVSLLEEGLLDEIRIMVNPVVIGKGTPLFAGINHKILFTRTHTRNFKNGNVLLTYKVS